MNTGIYGVTATLASRVYRTLRREIMAGQVRPGTRLVRRDIARRLGVSPIPVIEALLRLEQDGLVESRPNRGARVRAITPEGVADECMLREAIECQVARLVAERGATAQLDEMAVLARRLDVLMQRAEPASVIGMELHMELHLRLAELAGCSLLAQHLRGVWTRHLMQVNWLNATIAPVPAGWHLRLVTALQGGDADTAERAMREHVRYGQKTLSEAVRRLSEAGSESG